MWFWLRHIQCFHSAVVGVPHPLLSYLGVVRLRSRLAVIDCQMCRLKPCRSVDRSSPVLWRTREALTTSIALDTWGYRVTAVGECRVMWWGSPDCVPDPLLESWVTPFVVSVSIWPSTVCWFLWKWSVAVKSRFNVSLRFQRSDVGVSISNRNRMLVLLLDVSRYGDCLDRIVCQWTWNLCRFFL
jgi:hypothetical protein